MRYTIINSEKHILITGFGGQGVIMAGEILGTAATLYDGKFATMTQAYGPEARGGACSAQIIISEEEVLFPYIKEPHVLICLSQEGYSKNIGSLRDGGMLILESDLVRTKNISSNVTAYNIPATRFAEELGNKMMANIVMLGFLAAVYDLVSAEALRKTVLTSVPAPTRETNARAFERGSEYGKSTLKSRAKQGRVARD
ncbi:MAG: 2-oxoacid:acceptor oxidoreductase family protein [Syntrophales bacterium]|jgi:2-oxoglutarate ferredoxin oxidoreductase subunit gamma